MSVKLRMTRTGRRHRPFFRINAIDSRAPRDGKVLEKLGHYDPIEKDKDKQIVLNLERVKYWLDKGAIPSDTVSQILFRLGIKHKYAEEKAARTEKAKAIARAKGKFFKKTEKIAAEKAKAEADEKAKAEPQKAKEIKTEELSIEKTKPEEAPVEEKPEEKQESTPEEAPTEEKPPEPETQAEKVEEKPKKKEPEAEKLKEKEETKAKEAKPKTKNKAEEKKSEPDPGEDENKK